MTKVSNKGRKFPAEPLTPDEVRRLIGGCSRRAPTGVRNRALLTVMYRAGLRVSEALSLMPKDCNVEAGTLRVLKAKGQRARTVGLDAGAFSVLQVWLERRVQLGIGGRCPLFCTLGGEHLKTAYVRAMVRRLGKRAGIEKRCHPHGLRHTHAFELANEGTPMHIVQAQLGHANLSVTSRYVGHLNPTAVVTAIRGRQWTL
jgi:site-specific recombinase XerD